MKNSALSWSLGLRRVSLLAVACLLPVVACSGALTGVAEEAPSPDLSDGGPMLDAASGKALSDARFPESLEDASTPEPSADSATDSLSEAAADAGDAGNSGAVLRSGDVPMPVAIRRLTNTSSAVGPGGVIGPCPSGQISVSPMANVYSCCFKDEAASLVKPVLLTDRIVGGVEKVCLEGALGGASVCSPVDAQGLATFVESVELSNLYGYWGLMYNPTFSETWLSVQLSSSRDRATMKITVYGRVFGSGCGRGQGTYLPTTTMDIALR